MDEEKDIKMVVDHGHEDYGSSIDGGDDYSSSNNTGDDDYGPISSSSSKSASLSASTPASAASVMSSSPSSSSTASADIANKWIYLPTGSRSILDLDEDCLFEILSYIVNIREKLRLKLVCKRFEAVIVNYLQSRSIQITEDKHLFYKSEIAKRKNDDDSPKPEICFESLLVNCRRLSHLNTSLFPKCVWWELRNLEDNIPSLVNLKIDASHPSLSNHHLETFLGKAINLNSLTLVDFARKKFNFSCLGSNIRQIELNNFHSQDSLSSLFKLLQEKGSQLTHLKLEGYKAIRRFQIDSLSEDALNQIVSNCPNLEALDISKFFILESVEPLLRLKNMKQIYISPLGPDEKRLTQREYTQILVNNPGLTRLSLMIPPNEVVDFFKACLANCPDLESIDTCRTSSYDKQTTDTVLKLWHKFKKLEKVDGDDYVKFSTRKSLSTQPFQFGFMDLGLFA